ncbi:ATP-binding cassette domain-containing protein [Gemella sp. zg-1178]|uniref:ATP-binding cassette domain-containing protein n=1 Tax=Gemella sp. zg-1178 TaxID=2840372 RepID=UPI001C05021C|nr:ATP-binding cassette domain-containing protein [Gemella sp. zg-1178]MBU0278019.1 ATP-binding cassette domain-containing protein [Gemella sp. zg-1178]
MQIEFNKVNFTYNAKTPYENKVLKNINLKIKDNSFTAIVGKTGSGKSTLIEHINGLVLADSGFVKIGDLILEKNKKGKARKLLENNLVDIRKNIAVLFQFSEQQLFETSVLKDIIYGSINYGLSEKEAIAKAKDLIKLVGLDETYLERSPFELSGGEMRKVALCGVLALNPKVLVLDEPTIGLDFKSKSEFMELIADIYKKEKITIILVTHNMEYVLEYANHIVIMESGKIVEDIDDKEYFIKIIENNKYSLQAPEMIKFQKKIMDRGLKLSKIHYNYEDLIQDLYSRVGSYNE